MVVLFECTSNQIVRRGDYADMQAASATLPEGAYTTFRTYHRSRVLRLEHHAVRLRESVALMGGSAQLTDEAVRAAVREALSRTGYEESRLRLTLPGSGDGAAGRLFVSIEPFTPYPEALFQSGAACITDALRRDNPHAKSTAFIASAGRAYQALPPGVHEGLMAAEDGAVLEGYSSSFFAVLDGALHTEQARALVGVTQSIVLELARQAWPDLPVVAAAVHLADLPRASECFITSVSREVLPVTRIDGQPVGEGRPGPVSLRLLAAYRALVEREARPV